MKIAIGKDDLMFITSGKLSRDVYKELADTSTKHSFLLKVLLIDYLLFAGVILYSANHGMIKFAVVCIITFFVFGIIAFLIRTGRILSAVQRTREIYGSDSVDYMTGFTDDYIYTEVYTESGLTVDSLAISYDNVKRLHSSKHYTFIITKGGQAFTVFKDCLSRDEQKKLSDFVNSKVKLSRKKKLS